MLENIYRLTISCPDQPGIVAEVASLVAQSGGNILEANHHTDHASGWFFMRHEIDVSTMAQGPENFAQAFAQLGEKFSMKWQWHKASDKKKIALFVSKESHCLADLLHRWHEGLLPGEVVCVIGNHKDLAHMAQWYQVPFYHVPVEKAHREKAFLQMEALVEGHQADVIVLARFMQIIPPQWCQTYAGRMINIHHSFLPSFVGAKPYHQAYDRGVKLIGATCHYVTPELDAGPIIEQDVIRVSHRHTIEDMKRLGQDVEKTVLARGLRNHLEDRVLIHGNKTIVFDN